MPIIKLWCLPQQTEDQLNLLHQAIVKEVCSIKELGFRDENDMVVLFPPDMMSYGLGSEVFVEISGIFNAPEVTPEPLNRLAKNIGQMVSSKFPEAKVECFVNQVKPSAGFWTSTSTQ